MRSAKFLGIIGIVLVGIWGQAAHSAHPPVNPNATPEARAVLQYFYEISGKGIVAGVHGQNWDPDNMFDLVKDETGKYPGFYSGDFRYGKDLENRRRLVVDEMKEKWHQDKVICSLMWHSTRPLDPETEGWSNVQSDGLTADETEKLLTPGTAWHTAWMGKLDGIAEYLKELQDENIPILWRPFHEMNGGWFWWGKNPRFDEMWIQMYERFTNHHQLNNLLWVWSANCVVYGAGELHDYYPGHDYVDILAEDIYANKSYDWEQYFYDDLLELAEGRPISMGEVGDLPDPAFLKEHQPNWVTFMLWPGYQHQYANNPTRNSYVYNHEFSITADELPQSLFDAEVDNYSPQAAFIWSGETDATPATISFDASGSEDHDGSVTQWSWDFGDGQSGSGQIADHTYQAEQSYTVVLTVTDDSGASASAEQTIFIGPRPPQALFVAGETSLNAGDAAVRDRLQTLGYQVTVMDDEATTAAAADEVDIILISSTSISSSIGSTFMNVAKPTIVWETWLYDDMGMCGASAEADYGTAETASSIEITDNSHTIAAGLSGSVHVGESIGWGSPGAGATIVATVGNTSQAAIFAYESGVAMVSGSAPARRVGFLLSDNTAANLSADGWRMFDAAVGWATANLATSAESIHHVSRKMLTTPAAARKAITGYDVRGRRVPCTLGAAAGVTVHPGKGTALQLER